MNQLNRSVWIATLLLGTTLACRSDPSPGQQAQPSAKAAAPLPTPAVKPRREPLIAPTEADYEDEVEQRITAKNLEAELDRLEQELKQ